MIEVIWQFRAKPGKTVEFERDYCATGIWAQLFRKSPGYLESVLLRDAESGNRYIVIDRWKTAAAYEQFKKEYAAQYAAIDRQCEKLTEEETRIGIFETL
jgi:heme-degrading monooxygenase HmoA